MIRYTKDITDAVYRERINCSNYLQIKGDQTIRDSIIEYVTDLTSQCHRALTAIFSIYETYRCGLFEDNSVTLKPLEGNISK